MIGILGGMGPAATVDLMTKLIRGTGAAQEQDHLPLAVIADPRVPDRVAPIVEGRGESPLPAMVAGLHRLERAGATCVAIPCHTAHYWYDDLAVATALPILHIADAILAALDRRPELADPIGLLATAATLKAGFHQTRLTAAGRQWIEPSPTLMSESVLPAIALVKGDQADAAARLLTQAIQGMIDQGARTVLLACTELPVAHDAGPRHPACLDATEALAQACIEWYQSDAD